MDGYPHTTLELRLSFPTSNRDSDERATIYIDDGPSNMRVATISLNAEQVTSLLASRQVEVDAEMLPAHLRDRIGRQRYNLQERVPADILRGIYDPAKGQELAALWASARMDELNAELPQSDQWETFDVTHHNYGWAARFLRWAARFLRWAETTEDQP
jgi:hypothetical protein